MTTPTERARALRWGFELLSLLSDDTVAAGLRSRAKALLTAYPRPEALHHFLKNEPTCWPDHWLAALHQAERLFYDAQEGGPMYAFLMEAIRRTRRHFPSTGEIEEFRTKANSLELSRHLFPEDECEQRPLRDLLLPLDEELHKRILNRGGAKPSTCESAMNALRQIRNARNKS